MAQKENSQAMITKHRTAVNKDLALYKVESYNREGGFEVLNLASRCSIWTSNFSPPYLPSGRAVSIIPGVGGYYSPRAIFRSSPEAANPILLT